MRNASAKREALHSWLDRLDDAGVDRLFLIMRELDTNLRHQAAPAGWIPLHQVAELLGRDRRHLTRSCTAWAALGKARKFVLGRQLAWHLAADLAASLGATPRNGCATREAEKPRAAQSARPVGATFDAPSNCDRSPVVAASNPTSPAAAPSKEGRAPTPDSAAASKLPTTPATCA